MAHWILLCVVYLAFVSLGLPDSVFGVAWPTMRSGFERPLEAAGLVMLAVTACSALSGFASGAVLKRLGTGPVVLLSGFLTGLALLGFAFAPSFHWLLLFALPLGLGAGAVDAGLNHFVAAHYSSRHMNWLHACWGVGATIGPLLMGAALVGAQGWRAGYQTIASVQLLLAMVFLLTLALWRREHGTGPSAVAALADVSPQRPVPAWAAWLAPTLYLAYATIEVGTGLWAASILVEERRLAPQMAGFWVACFFGAIMGGRFCLGLVSAWLGNRVLVRAGIGLAIVGAALFAVPGLPPALSLAGLVMLGLGAAPIYPALMHETTRRFSADLARKAVGRQVAFSYIGGAVGPAALGLLGAQWGLNLIMPGVLLALFVLWLMVWRLDQVT
ncbi:MAG: MFS transporter [Rhodoferax sp.]|nr:MFS transporter [Rhodoferax sp.]